MSGKRNHEAMRLYRRLLTLTENEGIRDFMVEVLNLYWPTLTSLRFYRVELDKEKIQAFVREGFEEKLGKENVLGIQFLSWPNEFAVIVTVRKETAETSEISRQLQETLLDHGFSAIIDVREAQP